MAIGLCEPEICTACGACVNICPKDALRLTAKDGEPYRVELDEAACVHCGRCSKVCPQMNPQPKSNRPKPDCYAVCASDEIRRASSSGGVFTLLAEEVLAGGGKVFGCAYGEDLMPRQVCIASREELNRLQKSKYTQSDTGRSFREAKTCLERGETVLFTGLPCQITGLKAYLGKAYDNLYTMDIVCSGTAPAGIYRQYLAGLEAQYGKKIAGLDFRDKRNGWGCGHLVLKFADGTEANENPNPYMQALIQGYFRQGACLNCTSATFPRPADITAGDFWNLEKYDPKLCNPLGTSLVTLNSDKGTALFEAACRRNPPVQCAPVPFDFTRRSNWFTDRRTPHEKAGRFKELLIRHDVRTAYEMTRSDHYDVCVVGNWSGYNYGAHLTQYALYRTLTDEGYSVLMLEKPNKAPYRPQETPRLFRENPYPVYALAPLYEGLWDMLELNRRVESFVVGSDQLWNYNLFGHSMEFYALEFVKRHKNKVSYATSFGDVGYDGFPAAARKKFVSLLKRFDSISVRESSGVETCRRMGIKAEWALDPVFLCKREHFTALAEKSRLNLPEHYLFAYMVHPEKRTIKMLGKIAREKGLEVLCTADAMRKEKVPGVRVRYLDKVKVEDWLKLLLHSDCVIADSFHAYAFSLIFEKQIVPVYADSVYEHRVRDLSRRLGCPAPQIIEENEEYDAASVLNRSAIDYRSVNARLDEEREKCRRWLREAIDGGGQGIRDPEGDSHWKEDLRFKTYENEISDLKDQIDQIEHSATFVAGQTLLLPLRKLVRAFGWARGQPKEDRRW